MILTTYDVDEYVFAALRAGASGFLLKDVRPPELTEAIRIVARGDPLLAPGVTRRLLDRFAGVLPDDAAPGRPRRADRSRGRGAALRRARVVERRDRLAARADRGDREDARLRRLRKLGLRDRVQAVVLAYDVGLVRPRSS